jgi:hypothetical protein
MGIAWSAHIGGFIVGAALIQIYLGYEHEYTRQRFRRVLLCRKLASVFDSGTSLTTNGHHKPPDLTCDIADPTVFQ